MDAGLLPDRWHEFFSAGAGAAGALLGLIFVAISIQLGAMERVPTVGLRARINLQALATILVTSLAALLPQPASWLGTELIGIGVAYVAILTNSVIRTARAAHGIPARMRNRLLAQNTLAGVQFLAGLSLVLGIGPGLFLEAPVVVIGLPVTLFNCWNVLFADELRAERAR